MKFIAFLLCFEFAVTGCKKSQPLPEATSSTVQLVKVDSATAGSIVGNINFQGSLPRLPAIDMTADPACPKRPQPSDAVVINKGKLSNVFVYVKDGLPAGKFAVPSDPFLLDQKGCRYIPHMMGLMAGQPLKILNSDSADHNVHAMPTHNPQWNESQTPSDPAIVKTFVQPEMMIPVQCNQHPWMRAYINVMTHPYFAVSGPGGEFEIVNLPPGEYTLAALHEKFGEQTVRVKVEPKQRAKADFTFSASQ